MNDNMRKKKKKKNSVLEKMLFDMVNASLKSAVDSALKEIFKNFK